MNPEYREQGIASKLLDKVEATLAAQAEKTGFPQEVELDTAQVPVLNFFLKHGYEVLPEDQEKLLKIQNGDPSLTMVSSPEDMGHQEKVGYLVDKAKFEAMGERDFWELDVPREERQGLYMKESFRIRLKKEILASSNEVDGFREKFGVRIRSILES